MMSNDKNFISIVIYIHNCEKILKDFLSKAYSTIDAHFMNYEIICVNDSSTDSSRNIVKDIAVNTKKGVFSIVNMSIYQGIELSMNAGVDLAIGDYVIEFNKINIDYDEKMIIQAYEKMLEGNDIVIVSPEKTNGLFARIFYWIYNRYSKSQYKIRRDSFTVISRRAINRVKSISRRIPYRKAMYVSSGLKVETLSYKPIRYFKENSPSGTYAIKEKTAIDSLILFTDVAYKVSIFITLILLMASMATAGYTMVIYFGKHKPVTGWTTIMLFMSFGFFGVFMMVAVVVKYLSVLIDLVFVKQQYLVESIEKISRQ